MATKTPNISELPHEKRALGAGRCAQYVTERFVEKPAERSPEVMLALMSEATSASRYVEQGNEW